MKLFFKTVLLLIILILTVSVVSFVIKPKDTAQALLQGIGAMAPDSLAGIVPDLAGFKGERTYLILLQNSHELRPTGGFIGNFGIVRVKDGEILSTEFEGSEYVDNLSKSGAIVPKAPTAVKTYLGQDFLYFRDINWDPDFKTAAQQAVQVYASQKGPHAATIDGVIGVNTDIASTVLAATGPITAGGVTFTGENVIDQLEYQVEIAWLDKAITKDQRKDIVKDLMEGIKDRIKAMTAQEKFALGKQLFESAQEKHMVFFDYRANVEHVYETQGLAGRMENPGTDFVGVVDANLLGFKTDRVMQRKISYEVSSSDHQLTSKLKLTYTNPGVRDYRTKDYRSYTRVYVPTGVSNVSIGGNVRNAAGDGGFDVYHEGAFTVIGFFHTDKLKTTNDYTIIYTLPDMAGDYGLTIWKQPGMNVPALSVRTPFDTFEGELTRDMKFTQKRGN